MKKKIIYIFVLMLFVQIIFSADNVRAAEELPDNAAKIIDSKITQVKTGTGPWDTDNNAGNDTSEDNDIVRSFDQVTWTIENTFGIKNGESQS